MKTTFSFIFTLFFAFATPLWAQYTTIERPDVGKSNTQTLYLDKIVLTDTAAILYMDAYGRPDTWIKIVSESTLNGASKIYKFQKAEGIEPDKEIYLPESGNISFALFFEPTDKNEKKVDFIEGNLDGAFKLQDISLSTKKENKKIRCMLKGEVKNRPQSSRLMLLKANEDLRVCPSVSIPIRNGRFEYELQCDETEAYELIFWDESMNGQWQSIDFFAEPGEISFSLNPIEQYNKNELKGGKLNDELWEYNRHIRSSYEPLYEKREKLENEKKYYVPSFYSLIEKIENTKDKAEKDSLMKEMHQLHASDSSLTPEAGELYEQVKKVNSETEEWQLNYLKNNKTLVSYYLLSTKIANAKFRQYDISNLIPLYTAFAEKYPEHPYTLKTGQFIGAFLIKPGNRYIDFTAPDLNGKPVTLSEQIKDKTALIDLWASWCGPCRRNSMNMIPVYEKFKDKGFTVIGVARENKSTDAMVNAIKKDGYPWLNLIELNDRNMIWRKYGAENGGGKTILVDKKGIILAVDPTAEEVEKILKEQL